MHLLRLPRNEHGKDYVVGDIHGHFNELEKLLGQAKFDRSRDRLISVGDGIDRGPESEKALRYLREPWFFSVLGNHEALLMAAQDFEPGMYEIWMRNGGDWAEQASEELLDELVDIYQTLPYVIEVDTVNGLVGVVHADLPAVKSWQDLTSKLEQGKFKKKEMQTMLWSRESYRSLRLAMLQPGTHTGKDISGVHRVYVGHSIVARPRPLGNMMFIDTGAYAAGMLSMIELASETIYSVQGAPFFEKLA